MARQLLRGESDAHSLRATALVISALRRSKPDSVAWDELYWKDQRSFYSSMYRSMRHALVDHARSR